MTIRRAALLAALLVGCSGNSNGLDAGPVDAGASDSGRSDAGELCPPAGTAPKDASFVVDAGRVTRGLDGATVELGNQAAGLCFGADTASDHLLSFTVPSDDAGFAPSGTYAAADVGLKLELLYFGGPSGPCSVSFPAASGTVTVAFRDAGSGLAASGTITASFATDGGLVFDGPFATSCP